MKKIISIVLILTCAFMLFSCGNSVSDTIDDLNKKYNSISPSKVVLESKQEFGDYTLEYNSTLKTGTVDGFAVTVYEYTETTLRDLEEGSGVEILEPIKSESHSWVYHEDKGYREDGGKWDSGGMDFTPETGAIALNLSKNTVKDFVNDAEKGAVTFTVVPENTEAVFGYKIDADVSVTIYYSVADITGVTISYKAVNPDEKKHPEVTTTISVEYSYESQVITIK